MCKNYIILHYMYTEAFVLDRYYAQAININLKIFTSDKSRSKIMQV